MAEHTMKFSVGTIIWSINTLFPPERLFCAFTWIEFLLAWIKIINNLTVTNMSIMKSITIHPHVIVCLVKPGLQNLDLIVGWGRISNIGLRIITLTIYDRKF